MEALGNIPNFYTAAPLHEPCAMILTPTTNWENCMLHTHKHTKTCIAWTAEYAPTPQTPERTHRRQKNEERTLEGHV